MRWFLRGHEQLYMQDRKLQCIGLLLLWTCWVWKRPSGTKHIRWGYLRLVMREPQRDGRQPRSISPHCCAFRKLCSCRMLTFNEAAVAKYVNWKIGFKSLQPWLIMCKPMYRTQRCRKHFECRVYFPHTSYFIFAHTVVGLKSRTHDTAPRLGQDDYQCPEVGDYKRKIELHNRNILQNSLRGRGNDAGQIIIFSYKWYNYYPYGKILNLILAFN